MSKRYKFTLDYDLTDYSHTLKNVYFASEWLFLNGGHITIKRGYSWDGCTFAIDTLETYEASCVHDALYQFKIDKSKSDKAFYDLLKQNGFQFAKIYYISVRLFGGLFY